MPSGGPRPGAGRKPTREAFAPKVRAAEKQIADRLPELIEKLLALAEQGDFRAAAYLVDRILGKPTQAVEAEHSGGVSIRVIYDDQLPDTHPGTGDLPADAPSGAEKGTGAAEAF